MSNDSISKHYHPSTVVLIDDSKTWLNSLSLQLDDDIIYRLYSDPQLALSYVLQKQKLSQALNRNKDSIEKLALELCSTERFNEISVLILDYSMPNLDGLSFIEALGSTNIKIIMITGEADQRLAVQLFNANKIQLFIMKREANLAVKINQGIRVLQQAYFQQTAPLIYSKPEALISMLQMPAVIKIFNTIYQQCQAVEYYFVPAVNAYLFIDKIGNKSWFILKANDELKETTDKLSYFEINAHCSYALVSYADYRDKSLTEINAIESFDQYMRQAWPPK